MSAVARDLFRWELQYLITELPAHVFIYIYIYIFIHTLVFSLEGRAWQEPEPSHVTGTALAHCILGKFVGVVCHCFPPPLDVHTLAAMCLRPYIYVCVCVCVF